MNDKMKELQAQIAAAQTSLEYCAPEEERGWRKRIYALSVERDALQARKAVIAVLRQKLVALFLDQRLDIIQAAFDGAKADIEDLNQLADLED